MRRTDNPSVNEWDVLIDTDGDEADFAVVGPDSGSFLWRLTATTLSRSPSTSTPAVVVPSSAFTCLNSGDRAAAVPARGRGLAAGGQEEFSYTARISFEVRREAEGSATFNPFTPPVQTGQFAIAFPDIFSPEITATIDRGSSSSAGEGMARGVPVQCGWSPQAQTIQLR